MAETSLQSVKQRFGIIGRSSLLDRALSTAIRVANTDLTVLINGESGVGKEVFSKIIHGLSNRKHAPFIAVNCGAIPEGTINSELFGHEKGAFTGATGDRKGYFETVHGGTIFLDEVGEMPLDTQAYLLRILETGEYIRVGSSKVQKTDVRVVAATNVDLLLRIKEGKFREDLYYRLNTVPIYVPALRERREDIFLLFLKFAYDFGEKYRTSSIVLTDDAVNILENYAWPGNIRELKNLAEQLSVLTDQNEIDAETLVRFFPQFLKRNLPVQHIDSSKENLSEREILYKLLFDMKSDLTDLKQLVFGLISTNNLDMPEYDGASLAPPMIEAQKPFPESRPHDDRPIILSDSARETYAKTEVVEENLSIEEMEKELILKALRKHQGKRKYAAQELGISERTLYRKINQYHLD